MNSLRLWLAVLLVFLFGSSAFALVTKPVPPVPRTGVPSMGVDLVELQFNTMPSHSGSGNDASSSHSGIARSTLSSTEMLIVMGNGRHYDFVKKKWSWREELRGQRRENFLLSWERARRLDNVNQLIPFSEMVSK